MGRLGAELTVRNGNVGGERRGWGKGCNVIRIIAGDRVVGLCRSVWREREQVGRQGLSHSPWRPADNVLGISDRSVQQPPKNTHDGRSPPAFFKTTAGLRQRTKCNLLVTNPHAVRRRK